MTEVQYASTRAAAWAPQGGNAVMPVEVVVTGRSTRLVPDLARYLAAVLGYTYGEDMLPVDAAPHGTLTDRELPAGGLAIRLDANQAAPTWADGDAEPELNPVRVVLVQRVTGDLADLETLLDRREAVEEVINNLAGAIGEGAPTPAPRPTPIPPVPPGPVIRGDFNADFNADFGS